MGGTPHPVVVQQMACKQQTLVSIAKAATTGWLLDAFTSKSAVVALPTVALA